MSEFRVIEDPIKDYPEPTGWRILVEPIDVEEVSDGGIVLPEEVQRAKEHLRYIGRVISMGPLCYKHSKFQNPGTTKSDEWCKVGDWIAYGRYDGQDIIVKSEKGRKPLRLLNDDSVLAVIKDPKSVLIYA